MIWFLIFQLQSLFKLTFYRNLDKDMHLGRQSFVSKDCHSCEFEQKLKPQYIEESPIHHNCNESLLKLRQGVLPIENLQLKNTSNVCCGCKIKCKYSSSCESCSNICKCFNSDSSIYEEASKSQQPECHKKTFRPLKDLGRGSLEKGNHVDTSVTIHKVPKLKTNLHATNVSQNTKCVRNQNYQHSVDEKCIPEYHENFPECMASVNNTLQFNEFCNTQPNKQSEVNSESEMETESPRNCDVYKKIQNAERSSESSDFMEMSSSENEEVVKIFQSGLKCITPSEDFAPLLKGIDGVNENYSNINGSIENDINSSSKINSSKTMDELNFREKFHPCRENVSSEEDAHKKFPVNFASQVVCSNCRNAISEDFRCRKCAPKSVWTFCNSPENSTDKISSKSGSENVTSVCQFSPVNLNTRKHNANIKDTTFCNSSFGNINTVNSATDSAANEESFIKNEFKHLDAILYSSHKKLLRTNERNIESKSSDRKNHLPFNRKSNARAPVRRVKQNRCSKDDGSVSKLCEYFTQSLVNNLSTNNSEMYTNSGACCNCTSTDSSASSCQSPSYVSFDDGIFSPKQNFLWNKDISSSDVASSVETEDFSNSLSHLPRKTFERVDNSCAELGNAFGYSSNFNSSSSSLNLGSPTIFDEIYQSLRSTSSDAYFDAKEFDFSRDESAISFFTAYEGQTETSRLEANSESISPEQLNGGSMLKTMSDEFDAIRDGLLAILSSASSMQSIDTKD